MVNPEQPARPNRRGSIITNLMNFDILPYMSHVTARIALKQIRRPPAAGNARDHRQSATVSPTPGLAGTLGRRTRLLPYCHGQSTAAAIRAITITSWPRTAALPVQPCAADVSQARSRAARRGNPVCCRDAGRKSAGGSPRGRSGSDRYPGRPATSANI